MKRIILTRLPRLAAFSHSTRRKRQPLFAPVTWFAPALLARVGQPSSTLVSLSQDGALSFVAERSRNKPP